MFRFSFEIAGEKQLDRALSGLTLSNYEDAWPVVAEEFYELEREQFKSEGRKGGERWQELSPEYAGWKAARYPGTQILERTGDLMKSLTSRSDANAVYNATPTSLSLGTKLKYAIYHQSNEPRTVLPRRPEVVMTEPFKRKVMKHLQTLQITRARELGLLPKSTGRTREWYRSRAERMAGFKRAMES